MRVKLSYTVDSDTVLREAAKLLNLSAEDMQQMVALFGAVQEELGGTSSDDDVVNIRRAHEMIEEFRQALLAVDTRLMEVTEIVLGYDEYRKASLDEAKPRLSEPPVLPSGDE
jgi:hypothetical protein